MGCGALRGRNAIPVATTTAIAPLTTEKQNGTVQVASLRDRLISLGSSSSVEVAPSDIIGASGAGAGLKLLSPGGDTAKQRLRHGAAVYVNMVKTKYEHFTDVAAAVGELVGVGFDPIPHVPAARFNTVADFRQTLSKLADAGAKRMLVVGGNDLQDRCNDGSCAYPGGARALLAAELGALRAHGVTTIGLAGHPDGHPSLGWDAAKTEQLLVEKVTTVLAAGLDAAVVTQFCFDARKLISWLKHTRHVLRNLVIQHGCMAAPILPGNAADPPERYGFVTFHIGLPGPTPRKKLERIAKICEVPSLFVASAFDVIDRDVDGLISLQDLNDAIETLGLARKGSKLHKMYTEHAGADGLLSRDEFSKLLVDDAVTDSDGRGPSVLTQPGMNQSPRQVSGPSAFVNGAASEGSGDVWPEELVLALAAYCERDGVTAGEVALHFFPFGGLPKTLELTSSLSDGSWPQLTEDMCA